MNEDDIAEVAGPVLFLAQRARLAALRKAAEIVPISSETEAELDQLLKETESITRMLVMPTSVDEVEYFDDLFDDDLISLCATLRVNLVAWVNQPQVLMRFRNPNALLTRWLEIWSECDTVGAGQSFTPVFAQQVEAIESAIRIAFDTHMKNTLR